MYFFIFASTNFRYWLVHGKFTKIHCKHKVWNSVLGDCFSDLFRVTVADRIIAYMNARALVPYSQPLFLSWRCDVCESIKQLHFILNAFNLTLQGGELEMQPTQNPSIFKIRYDGIRIFIAERSILRWR